MVKTYQVSGMTCMGCVSSVKEKLNSIEGVEKVQVDLEKAQAEINANRPLSLAELRGALPSKYTIEENQEPLQVSDAPVTKSKLQQLKPLFLIFAYLFGAAILLNYKEWSMQEAMLDFMGLFYIVFSFFKFLDLKGFPESFKMYDPLAKVLPAYGWIYPFLELGLGLLFLMRFQIQLALIVTIIILGITTIGVTKTLLDKKSIRCACLGTALNLPMTEATFIENAIMLLMAIAMLVL
ncbi:heavy-metal-associated domain-containing protein [Croceivirga thetidis]|uniref:Heavy metal transporter n=1 Tax=Croceivirga thetidis TaxID=2721623 RepID=A0ABX1GP69_9FLAO|nr:heavy metal-associated domain-containing protein [Croceivirga thetidis]NKI31708.1 heavy metal transporter [Croceivirga thetidis]